MKKLLFCMFIALIGLQVKAISQTPNDTIVLIKKQFDTAFFIPDGPMCPNQCYETGIIIDTFPEGSVINSINDIASVCMKMDHSFSGDLGIYLICPTGQEVALMTFLGSGCTRYDRNPNLPILPLGTSCNNGGAMLGVPPNRIRQIPGMPSPDGCTDSLHAQGIGWQYCWSERYLDSTRGAIGFHTRGGSTIDSSDYENRSGFFTPDTSFGNLIGCPLNGEWKIKVCDYWGVDCGWLYEWSLGLSTAGIVPDNLLATNITKKSATITCENEMNKTFVLEYKREDDIEWVSKIVLGSEIGLTDLAPDTKYQMRAYCFLGDGVTKLETEIDSFTTASCSSPEFIIGSVTTGSAVITFENEPESESRFEYKKATDTEWIPQTISASSVELTNLEEGTKYQVRVYCSFDETTKLDAKIDSFTTKLLGINGTGQQERMFDVYPNPAKDILYIKSSGISGILDVNILDIKGVHILSQKITCDKDNKEYKIPLTSLSKGTYFVRISYNNYVETKKILIQ